MRNDHVQSDRAEKRENLTLLVNNANMSAAEVKDILVGISVEFYVCAIHAILFAERVYPRDRFEGKIRFGGLVMHCVGEDDVTLFVDNFCETIRYLIRLNGLKSVKCTLQKGSTSLRSYILNFQISTPLCEPSPNRHLVIDSIEKSCHDKHVIGTVFLQSNVLRLGRDVLSVIHFMTPVSSSNCSLSLSILARQDLMSLAQHQNHDFHVFAWIQNDASWLNSSNAVEDTTENVKPLHCPEFGCGASLMLQDY
ncbi:hypothetical protein ACOME3_000846 [Neoechinorhynchus agilis]